MWHFYRIYKEWYHESGSIIKRIIFKTILKSVTFSGFAKSSGKDPFGFDVPEHLPDSDSSETDTALPYSIISGIIFVGLCRTVPGTMKEMEQYTRGAESPAEDT